MLKLNALSAVILLTVSSCSLPLTPYRYRLTIEVDTPQGLRSGSSVIDVRTWTSNGWPDSGITSSVRGEGVAVDLPNGQTLFALLDGEDGQGAAAYAENAYEPVLAKKVGPLGLHVSEGDLLRELKRQREPMVLPRKVVGRFREPRPIYPFFVRFRDLRDPASVEQVDPDDLAASFGTGFKLRRIVVQITDDPITEGMKARLPWLPHYYDKVLDGKPSTTRADLNDRVGAGSFSTEAK